MNFVLTNTIKREISFRTCVVWIGVFVDNEPTVDSAVLAWNDLFFSTANKHAPIKTTRIKGFKFPWLTTELMDTMRKRDFYRKKAKKSNLQSHWVLYKKLRNLVNSEVKRCKAEYYTRLIDQNRQNQSALWKTLNEVTSRKKSDPVSCIESDGIIYSGSKSIANILNQHFSSVASILVQKLKASMNILLCLQIRLSLQLILTVLFYFTPVSEEFVLKELKRLKSNKAIGLDGISARLMKDSVVPLFMYKRNIEKPNMNIEYIYNLSFLLSFDSSLEHMSSISFGPCVQRSLSVATILPFMD